MADPRHDASARNQRKERIIAISRGATTSHVRMDIGGAIVPASIINEAVDKLRLANGQRIYAGSRRPA
jgi:molybdopterin-binding protein